MPTEISSPDDSLNAGVRAIVSVIVTIIENIRKSNGVAREGQAEAKSFQIWGIDGCSPSFPSSDINFSFTDNVKPVSELFGYCFRLLTLEKAVIVSRSTVMTGLRVECFNSNFYHGPAVLPFATVSSKK